MAEDTKLTSAEFAAKIKAKYPQYAEIPDDELAQRIVSKHPEYADKVILSAAKPAPVVPRPLPDPFTLPGNMAQGVDLTNQPDTGEGTLNAIPALGGGIGGALGGIPGAMLGGAAGESAKGLIKTAVTGKPTESPVTDIAESGALQGLFEGGGQAASWLGGKLAPMAQQSLARILRLSPKAFQFGKEPAQEVLEKGLASGDLKTMVEHIGQASKDATSQLNAALKAAPGTVNVFDIASDVSKNIPNQAAANRFEQMVLDAADKLGLKNLGKLTNAETNALKQEVAQQARYVEGDLRPSIANAAKVFGGKAKDRMIANAPKAKPLFESSANLTEASKAGDYAVRAEKAGQGRSALSAVDIKRPSTYPRAVTDTITGAKTLFRFANALKESVPISTALRMAFSLIYPGATNGEEQ